MASYKDSEFERSMIVDFTAFVSTLWRFKYLLILIMVVVVSSTYIYVSQVTPTYRSSVTLAPVNPAQKGKSLIGRLGGLASMAGFNLGGSAGVDQTDLALEILKSRTFLVEFAKSNGVAEVLFGALAWNKEDGIIYDPDIYDQSKNLWVKPRPADWQIAKRFVSRALIISRSKDSGMVYVQVESISPYLSQKWTRALITSLNDYLREDAIKESSLSIQYLREELEATDVSNMQQVFYDLIEEQQKNIMLANVRKDYALKVIDAPVVVDAPVSPKKPLAFVIAVMFSIFVYIALSIFILVYKSFRSTVRKN